MSSGVTYYSFATTFVVSCHYSSVIKISCLILLSLAVSSLTYSIVDVCTYILICYNRSTLTDNRMGSQCLNTTAAKDSPFFFLTGDGLTIRGVLSSDS